ACQLFLPRQYRYRVLPQSLDLNWKNDSWPSMSPATRVCPSGRKRSEVINPSRSSTNRSTDSPVATSQTLISPTTVPVRVGFEKEPDPEKSFRTPSRGRFFREPLPDRRNLLSGEKAIGRDASSCAAVTFLMSPLSTLHR